MRDYYTEFISRVSEECSVGEVSKVSKPDLGLSNNSFDTFAPDPIPNDSEFSPLTKDDREIELEERIAIMMFDGGFSETEARALLQADAQPGFTLE